jgi:hypothetical protein
MMVSCKVLSVWWLWQDDTFSTLAGDNRTLGAGKESMQGHGTVSALQWESQPGANAWTVERDVMMLEARFGYFTNCVG